MDDDGDESKPGRAAIGAGEGGGGGSMTGRGLLLPSREEIDDGGRLKEAAAAAIT